MKWWEGLAFVSGVVYLIVLGWAMQTISFDVWGALVLVPVLVMISAPLIRKAFQGDLEPLRRWAFVGLFVKFAGAAAGYWVRFDSYGGAADAERYHRSGSALAENVRSGVSSPLSLLPSGQSTRFIEELTGLVYTIFGSSRLGGFVVFTWFSYWGLVFFIKAAAVAIPGLATRRYALAVFLFPSIVYWGSSIGKEAFMGLCLGLGAYGGALLLSRGHDNRNAVIYTAIGLGLALIVRPHYAAIWAGAIMIALLARLATDITSVDEETGEKRRIPFSSVALVAVAGIGFVIIATITLSYLDPADDDQTNVAVTDRLSTIFENTEERTLQGGSRFTPLPVSGPQDWPYAIFRTITRPLITEASGFGQLLPAVEMTAMLMVGLFSWRRLANAVRLLPKTPYLVFALLCVGTFGVAFSSFGNLGLLVRQRSLVLPLVLLFLCIPPLPERRLAAASDGRLRFDAKRPIGLSR